MNQLKQQLSALEARFKAQYAEFVSSLEIQMAASSRGQAKAEDEAYLMLLSDEVDPEKSLQRIKQQKVDDLHQKYEMGRQQLVSEYTMRSSLAVVHCYTCGHIIGVGEPPRQLETALQRVQSEFAQLRQAVVEMSVAITSSLQAIEKHAAKLLAHQESAGAQAGLSTVQHIISTAIGS